MSQRRNTYDIDTSVSRNRNDGVERPEIYTDDYFRYQPFDVPQALGGGMFPYHSFSQITFFELFVRAIRILESNFELVREVVLISEKEVKE